MLGHGNNRESALNRSFAGRAQATGLRQGWLIIVLLSFALVYLRSLSFTYVEGDDAASLAYHVFGRDPAVQPPYSPYQGMMDVALGLLPARETLLIGVSIGLTSISAVWTTILTLRLVFDWVGIPHRLRTMISTLLLLGTPEIFFLGLYYSPSVIALALVLSSHHLARKGFKEARLHRFAELWIQPAIPFSLVLFGIGAACRWDIAAYGLVVVADLLTIFGRLPDIASDRRHIIQVLLWGTAAVVVSVIAIMSSGYGIHDIIHAVEGSTSYETTTGSLSATKSWLAVIGFRGALIISLITPVIGLFAAIGITKFLNKRNPILLVVAAGALAVLPWVIRLGVPKMLLPALPLIWCCAAQGLLVTLSNPARRTFVLGTLIIGLALLPWIVGIRISFADTAWGPAFEIRPYDKTQRQSGRMNIVIGAGSAFPTSEGPRSLLGYWFVLLEGGWKKFVLHRAEEVRQVVETAITAGVPLLVTETPEWVTMRLLSSGFSTKDHQDRPSPSGFLNERRFVARDGRALLLYGCEIDGGSGRDLWRLTNLANVDHGVAVIKGYPGTLRQLYQIAPENMKKLGPTSAVLQLDRLPEALIKAGMRDNGLTTARRCGSQKQEK